MNTSSTEFDFEIDKIEHYRKYPIMRPYIGKNYKDSSKKILLIAESHYLPPYSNVSNNVDKWYDGNEDLLNEEEKSWTNTRAILSCNWNNGGHKIYRVLESKLAEEFVSVNGSRSMSSVVFMNAFQRPSPSSGNSIKNSCTERDIKESVETIQKLVEILKPNLVLFISKFTWDKLNSRLLKDSNVQYDFTCHPSASWRYWNDKNYPFGKTKFSDLIKSN